MTSIRLILALAVLVLFVTTGRHTPAVHAQQAPLLASFRGDTASCVAQGICADFSEGQDERYILQPLRLDPGLVVVHAKHSGSGNLGVALAQPSDPNSDPAHGTVGPSTDLGITVYGTGSAAGAAQITVSSNYYIVLGGDGTFQIDVEAPTASTVVPVLQSNFSGSGDQVTPYFFLPAGQYTLTYTVDGSDSWYVQLRDLDGNLINADDGSEGTAGCRVGFKGQCLVGVNTPASGSVSFAVVFDGPYILQVNGGFSAGALNWTISIQ